MKAESSTNVNHKRMTHKRISSQRKHDGRLCSILCPPAPYNTTSYIIDFHRSEVDSFGLQSEYAQEDDGQPLLDINDLEKYDTTRFVRCSRWEEKPYDVLSVADIEE